MEFSLSPLRLGWPLSWTVNSFKAGSHFNAMNSRPSPSPQPRFVLPRDGTSPAVSRGLILTARTSTGAAAVSRAPALPSSARLTPPTAARGRSGSGWPGLQIPEGNGGGGYRSDFWDLWSRQRDWPTLRALRVASSLPASLSGSDASGRPGQFLERPGIKGRQVGGRAC